MSREDIPGGRTLQTWGKGISKAKTRVHVFGGGRASPLKTPEFGADLESH